MKVDFSIETLTFILSANISISHNLKQPFSIISTKLFPPQFLHHLEEKMMSPQHLLK